MMATSPVHLDQQEMQIPPLGDFMLDLEQKLGRANGNIYHRQAGIPSVHDGQIMVRLKKKRYVILDYGIVPNDFDIQLADENPHIKIPKGAGRDACKTPDCHKVGVPVCIYDSEPSETDSLYLRTGLCFSCQRNLNEKRRTERKRAHSKVPTADEDGIEPSVLYAMGPSPKKFRFKHGDFFELASDAVIVNGAIEGTRHFGDGYGFQEIGVDLISNSRDAWVDVERLVQSVSSGAVSAAVAAVAAVGDGSGSDSPLDENGHEAVNVATTNEEDISMLYHKAFQSLSKSMFLLTQWKSSWEAALEAAHETVADPSLADAVASAAAVAAVATPPEMIVDNGSADPSSNMATLIMAADDQRKEHDGEDVVDSVVDAFV